MLDWTPGERALLGDVEPLADGYTLSPADAKAAPAAFYAARSSPGTAAPFTLWRTGPGTGKVKQRRHIP
jgi:hypothetical protein